MERSFIHTYIHTKASLLDVRRGMEDKALSSDLWRAILENLPVSSLGRAACVCRLWHSIAGSREVLLNAFMRPWNLKNVLGSPSSPLFWRDATLSRFAISHTVQRWDTVASLAVKYQVHVIEIMRLNNMMSDHGIHSRERLLIPIVQPEVLEGGTCYIEMDEYANREVAVLYVNGEMPKNYSIKGVKEGSGERLKRCMIDYMKRSLHTDDDTAQYYLSLAEGDLRVACNRFIEDMSWEHSTFLSQGRSSFGR